MSFSVNGTENTQNTFPWHPGQLLEDGGHQLRVEVFPDPELTPVG